MNDALIQAADCDLESAKELLEAGANPNGIPLIMAIQCGAEDIVSLFIKAGVDLNSSCSDTTPLIRAVTAGYPNIVKLLVVNGAKPSLKDNSGKTAKQRLAECSMPRLNEQNKKFIAEYLDGAKQI
ncbi:ankyrin repeat domain-containing protein [Pseudoalteromonas sp. CnMc7-15]|uniref:ankyrin repeat domain-containing protein n=1 Tax=unclassified Pseudoalteromonas TaxID=194690 RepID=UPI001EF71496|nr:ankyrin repeat domain-containing protein [Pseudoalteromonas sp. CnMc7-15]MCG7564958.1 ankyrin repeat domain-containing protein [Pseudoalteromonas sp. CnMc7-15]